MKPQWEIHIMLCKDLNQQLLQNLDDINDFRCNFQKRCLTRISRKYNLNKVFKLIISRNLPYLNFSMLKLNSVQYILHIQWNIKVWLYLGAQTFCLLWSSSFYTPELQKCINFSNVPNWIFIYIPAFSLRLMLRSFFFST